MIKLFLKFTSIVILFSMFISASAQERIFRGTVYTFDSIPLIDVNVEAKGTKQVVKTDTLGNFQISCNNNDVLKVWAYGFNTEKFKINPKLKYAVINLKLKPGQKNREVAIGYGYVKDADKLNSIANLNDSDVDFSRYNNMYELIRGRFPGVQIVNGEIIIRGINSITSSNAALIVLDGIPVENSILSTLPPVEVKSINIIKDAGSAIYGTRGANGVVLIETKRGGDK